MHKDSHSSSAFPGKCHGQVSEEPPSSRGFKASAEKRQIQHLRTRLQKDRAIIGTFEHHLFGRTYRVNASAHTRRHTQRANAGCQSLRVTPPTSNQQEEQRERARDLACHRLRHFNQLLDLLVQSLTTPARRSLVQVLAQPLHSTFGQRRFALGCREHRVEVDDVNLLCVSSVTLKHVPGLAAARLKRPSDGKHAIAPKRRVMYLQSLQTMTHKSMNHL